MTATQVPTLATLRIEQPSPHALKLKGTITTKEPAQELGTFFQSLHRDAIAQKATDVLVDVSELTFVNSSSIRLFVDWASWIRNEAGHRYTLRFRTSNKITWQKTSFTALTSLMKDVLKVEPID